MGSIVQRGLSALVLLLGIAAAGNSHADVMPGSQRAVQGWQLAAYDRRGQGFDHCGIYAGYRSGITMHFVMFANRAWSVGWQHDSWNFRGGQQVPAQLYVDGQGPHGIVAVAQLRNFILANLPPQGGLFDLIRRGNQMEIQVGNGGRLGFRLDGTSVALAELAACVDRYTGVARAPNLAPNPTPSPAAPSGPPSSAVPQTSAAPPLITVFTRKLNDAQVQQLTAASCDGNPFKTRDSRPEWACARPRNYPNRPAGSACQIGFAENQGEWMIWYGRFTAPHPQAIAMYHAACEPRARGSGGTALFDIVDGRFKLVQFYTGARFTDCAGPPPDGGEPGPAYCIGGFMGQGQLTENFGPVHYLGNGEFNREQWAGSGNSDGAYVRPPVACGNTEPGLHHLVGVRWDASARRIVLEAARLHPQSIESACARFNRSEFDKAEQELRQQMEHMRAGGFLRDNEIRYVKVLLRFAPGNKTPDVEVTNEEVK